MLADVAGEDSADLLGRDAEEISRALGLGTAFASALASRKSWSGIEVEWPLERAGERVPATLGGLPVFDAERRFSGFQGYGVLHLSRALARPAAPETAREETPKDESGRSPPDFAAANVVPLRPYTGPPTNSQATHGKEGEGAAPASSDGDAALTPAEGAAFDEIARALGAGGPPQPHGPARDLMQRVGDAVAAETPPRRIDEAPLSRHAGALLDLLPVGMLVARGDALLYANRTLLDYLGYADLASFAADGGLARMFFGQPPRDVGARAATGAIEVRARDGETLEADAHLQSVAWDGGPAALVTLRRNRARAPREETRPPPGEEAEQLRAALDASTEAIAILGGEGRVVCVNAAFAQLTGVDKPTLAGQQLFSLFAPEDARALAERLARANAGEGAGALRLSVKTPRGLAPIDAAIQRLGAAPGSRLCVTLRDLAPAWRTRDELEAARAEAERASAAKSEFLARVSHEIRTPLNAILGFAEVMMEERFGPIGSERYKEYLKDVHASGALVLSLVNDLLDLSKIEAGKMELDFARVDANAVITECVSIMQPQANQGRVIMRVALAPRLPGIRADERSLRQILLNLLSNAVKFNEPGGQVIVSTALTDAGFVVIRVKDTGIGMSETDIETALEPFGQVATSRAAGGTGLGLPVTKALIEANHASFTIKSREHEGTLIEVAFPPPQVLAAE
jgi:signal transduction histidine kinase